MSIGLVVTRGFGNGVLIGSIAFAVTAGYTLKQATRISDATTGIKFPPDDRVMTLAFDDKTIKMPPDNRKMRFI